jgi:6-phosphogluconolactonase (cycloisomerase 2 family)
MRVVMLGLALAVLIARPAGAGRMLYATAASDNRIDGFCLRRNGSIESSPRVRQSMRGTQPRRLIPADGFNGVADGVDDVLYVVEADRVEAFAIGVNGGLGQFLGQTKPRERAGPRDAAISTATTPRMLYVPDRSLSRIVGFPLDDQGRPAEDFTTCIQADVGASLQNLVINGDKLYASMSSGNGRIQVFGIAADGRLFGNENPPLPPDTPLIQICGASGTDPDGKRSEPTVPFSERRKIADVKSFVIVGNLLYAEDRGRRRIRAFELLADGNFQAPTPDPTPNRPNRVIWPAALSKTSRVANYQQILHFRSALLGTQFFRGRIDSYRLEADGSLPKRVTRISHEDLRLTPVRLAAAENLSGSGATVYVASGEFDRVIAYRLDGNGALEGKGLKPFSQTSEQKNSFPNDVAVAMLREGCPD